MSENDNQTGQQQPLRKFVIPALRVFKVTRYTPGVSAFEPPDNIQELTVAAHVVQHSEDGQVLMFLDYIVDPLNGPMMQLRRMINGYIEMAEVTPARESSLLLQ